MGIELIPLCEIDITLGEPIVIGEGSQGLRLVYEVASGTIAGDRLRGVMHGTASADCPSADALSGPVAACAIASGVRSGTGASVTR